MEDLILSMRSSKLKTSHIGRRLKKLAPPRTAHRYSVGLRASGGPANGRKTFGGCPAYASHRRCHFARDLCLGRDTRQS